MHSLNKVVLQDYSVQIAVLDLRNTGAQALQISFGNHV